MVKNKYNTAMIEAIVSMRLFLDYGLPVDEAMGLVKKYEWVTDLHKFNDYDGITKDIVEQYQLNEK